MKRINWSKLRKNIPSSLHLGKKVFYEVLWIAGFRSDKFDEKTYGETRYELKQIVLNSDQIDKEATLTYWHEALHSISNEVGANLTETQVRALENAFPIIRELVLTLEGQMKKEARK